MTWRISVVFLISGLGCATCLLAARAGEAADGGNGPARLAGRVLQPDGTLQDNLVVVLQGDQISRVDEVVTGDQLALRRFGPDAVICPGLVNLLAVPGAVGQTVEDAKFIDPDASPLGVLDPSHGDFRAAPESGITTVLVAPSATNLVSGVCAMVRTHVADGQLEILRADGPLVFGFGEGVWQADRAPTSRAGAAHEFRQLVAHAQEGSAHPRINAALSGQLDAWISCSTSQDVALVRQLLGDASKHFRVIHSQDALDVAQTLKQLCQSVVVGPYSMETGRRELMGAAALADAGLEIAFRSDFPTTSRDAVRLSAALAVRHGLDPAAARRAITIAPAKFAGVADRIGSIAPGKDADLVIFSRDPLRMDARVLEVYVRGQRVFAAGQQPVSPAGARP